MTVDYTFAPLIVDASPISSRFAAPLDATAGVVWLEPLSDGCWYCRNSAAGLDRCDSCGKCRVVFTLSLRCIDLLFRPRRRGQRPAGMARSAWWRMRRGERREVGP
jgi:hypothetical protein